MPAKTPDHNEPTVDGTLAVASFVSTVLLVAYLVAAPIIYGDPQDVPLWYGAVFLAWFLATGVAWGLSLPGSPAYDEAAVTENIRDHLAARGHTDTPGNSGSTATTHAEYDEAVELEHVVRDVLASTFARESRRVKRREWMFLGFGLLLSIPVGMFTNYLSN